MDTHDNFGEDLLMALAPSIYYWDKTCGTGQRAVELSAATTGAASGTKPVSLLRQNKSLYRTKTGTLSHLGVTV